MVGFLLDYWQYALIGVGVLAAVGYVHERDNRIRQEAVANERLMDWKVANARADSLHKVHALTDSQVAVAQAHISRLRSRADSLARIAASQADEASIRLAQAGDSLTATLDSLYAVVPPELEPLALTARTQSRETIKAHRDAASAFRTQLNAMSTQLTAADSTSRLWQTRYTALEDAYEARVEECRECRETVEAMEAGQDQGWSTVHKLTAGVALLAVGYVAGAGF